MKKAYRPSVDRKPLRETIVRPIVEFAQTEANSGIILIACALVALIWANSPWRDSYHHLWHSDFGLQFGDKLFLKPLHFWINDALMAVFFLLVGLEIKREALIGELATLRKATLPFMAALGGMIVPAVIYFAFNTGTPGIRGWGVPMATDIAFALGVLTLCGDRVPFALKVFLAAVAIVDDLGAVLVIALFYSENIQAAYLAASGAVLVVLLIINSAGIRTPVPYILLGIVLWVLVFNSGIHATIAGVLLALTIPTKVSIDPVDFTTEAREALDEFARQGKEIGRTLMSDERQSAVRELEKSCERVQMPLERIENVLHPWVSLFIMPLFALANAGLTIEGNLLGSLASPIALGTALGLVVGKPVGIFFFSYLSVKLGMASLPSGIHWRHIFGVGMVAGIGFTMSLFIGSLAFGEGESLQIAKLSILIASVVAGVAGLVFFRYGRRLKRLALGR